MGFGLRATGFGAALLTMIGVPTISCAGGSAALSTGGEAARGAGAASSSEAARTEHAALLPAQGKPVEGSLQDLSGKELGVAALRGHPVLLDFFATWCEPCRVGLPHTDALVQKQSARGLIGWAISLDDHPDGVDAFAKKLQLVLPIRWDPGAKLADDIGVNVLPAAILLDAQGRIRYRGAADDRDFARHLEEATELLLAEERK